MNPAPDLELEMVQFLRVQNQRSNSPTINPLLCEIEGRNKLSWHPCRTVGSFSSSYFGGAYLPLYDDRSGISDCVGVTSLDRKKEATPVTIGILCQRIQPLTITVLQI